MEMEKTMFLPAPGMTGFIVLKGLRGLNYGQQLLEQVCARLLLFRMLMEMDLLIAWLVLMMTMSIVYPVTLLKLALKSGLIIQEEVFTVLLLSQMLMAMEFRTVWQQQPTLLLIAYLVQVQALEPFYGLTLMIMVIGILLQFPM